MKMVTFGDPVFW